MSAQLTRTSYPELPSPAAAPADSAQIDEIVERLARRYSRQQISVADLRARVRGFYFQYAAARIRTFVVILVERLVRRSIEDPSAGPHALY
jgi:hypothetical protein